MLLIRKLEAAAESVVQDEVQRIVTKAFAKEVDLKHLSFRPREKRGFWSRRLPEAKFQGVA